MPTRLTATILILLAIILPFDARATLAAPVNRLGASVWPDDSATFGSQAFASSMKLLRQDGANEVALVIPYQQASQTSIDIYPRSDTPTDDALRAGIQAAHSAGLHVSLRFYDETQAGTWRACIDPYDRQAWFRNYGDKLVWLGRLAESAGAEQVGIGTEMTSMTDPSSHPDNTARWQGMIARLRAVYSGNVMYAADRSYELSKVGFWNSVDTIGVTAYWPLAADKVAPTVQDLEASWVSIQRKAIDPITSYGKPIIFAEAGYPSYGGNHVSPWQPAYPGGYNEQEQTNDYQALFTYWSASGVLSGIDLWAWCIDPARCSGDLKAYSFQGKLAENVVRTGFGGMGAAPPATILPSQIYPPKPGPIETLPAQALLNVWWPIEGATLSGLQPFKAQLNGTSTDEYSMSWSVDGGVLNPMKYNEQEGPHYQSWVDSSSWSWHENGPYTLTFTATNRSGQQVAQTTRRIMVNR